ncbi:pantothenate transporter [Aaosphaeria arxii CBS 175.79]|uniref:Pantothenate transporter n=1 Tax=Aaosphaeria arxii CBS 175.79 TaxID=1450172 RepID=A0A6A5XRD3_9PLEO|nr:pantothenate transporter [Aaosphaeria arxii CBS 175.79]KAF2015865.1 pantothenate transporter [Aaosphaeria arxii CBS 175.79]
MSAKVSKRVAVVGAGISGVVTAAHLRKEGLEVVVFERSLAAGGIWLYDERKPLEPTYPAIIPSQAHYHYDGSKRASDQNIDAQTQRLIHAPPGPCYVGLKNNVETRLLQTTLNPFPVGTPDFVTHNVLLDYIQDTALVSGVHDITKYGTEVQHLRKEGDEWLLTATTLQANHTGSLTLQTDIYNFDAVVVASGHYHAARVPDIPGLADWKRQWPERVEHSKSFRKPEDYKGKNFLLIGGGVSSTDIARELAPFATNIYQSHRNGAFDLPASLLPENTVRIDEISCFEPLTNSSTGAPLSDTDPLPLTITLKSGRKLCNIDHVILCTGYHVTLPFLPHLHSDSTTSDAVDDTVLVADGTQMHNLHKDIFYIKDPSLSFVGVPFFTATFTLFEFQAMVVAKVISEQARLPTEQAMRREYDDKVKTKGYGKHFHSLRGIETEYVEDLLAWVNGDLEIAGRQKLKGHTEVWKVVKQEQIKRMEAMFAAPPGTTRELGILSHNLALATLLPLSNIRCLPTFHPSISKSRPIPAHRARRSADPSRHWYYYLWDTLDKPKEERWFMFKLDAALLTFASLGYFIKYLDQMNINSAFVSGMKEDLNLYGNELNYMQTCWTVGYVLGEIPSNIILTRVRPSIWIPSMEVLWSVLTFALSRADSATKIYILRFFIGLAESTFYPGMQYIIGSWYRKEELAKRSCIFHTSASIATMFSGYLMAGVYGLDGRHGFRGWQWLFLIDGVISLPIALMGFFFIPDVPEISKPFYLTPSEVQFAVKRMELEGRQKRKPYTKAKIRRIFTSWHIYALTLLYIFFNNGTAGAAPIFAQYLKASKHPKYTVKQINTYPTATNGMTVAATLVFAWTSDGLFRGARWPPIVFAGLVNIVCFVSLAVWTIPEGWRWFCYIISGMSGGLSGLCMAWAHEICTRDNEERAIVIGSMNEMAYVLQAWLPLIVWQQVEAPQYRKGFITITFLSAALIVTAFTIRTLHTRELGKRAGGAVESGITREDSAGSERESSVEEVVVSKDDDISRAKRVDS